MNSALGSRLGRAPSMGYSAMPSAGATVPGGPMSMQGGLQISGQAGQNGAGGVSGILLLGLVGLGVFYVATRSLQGFR